MTGPTITTKEWRLVILCATLFLNGLLVVSECEAQANYAEASATLLEKVQIPVEVNGKEVGKTSLPAGTKVTVVSRDGSRVSIKRGNLGPVWVEESQLSGLSDKKPEQSSKPVESDPAIELQKLNRLVSDKKWPQVAAACETMAQADEKFSGLGELAGRLTSALQAQASAVQQQKKAEVEAKRLKRNADVVGQPNSLNPSDTSPMQRAQRYREQADTLVEEAQNKLTEAQSKIAQLGKDISSEVSRLGDEEKARTVSADPLPESTTPKSIPESASTLAIRDSDANLQEHSPTPSATNYDEIKVKAEEGNADAQFGLGFFYSTGTHVSQDWNEAVKWYRKAADQGQAVAACYLGIMYATGEVVQQNSEEALKLLKYASEQEGDHAGKADGVLGKLFYEGIGVPQDYQEAAKWYRKAADQGEAGAQAKLAGMYMEGEGVERDLTEAAKLLRLAADRGDAFSQYCLGLLCYKGVGVPQDYLEAAAFFEKAASQGDQQSQFRLGMMYRSGTGVSKNKDIADSWLRKAADQGHLEAREALGKITPNNVKAFVEEAHMTSDDVKNLRAFSKQFGGHDKEELRLLQEEVNRVGR